MAQPQREWFEKDYYKVLGVPETATDKEIPHAYRNLAKQLNPDANPGDSTAESRFKDVSAAYDVLGDEAKRKEYDEVRKLGPVGGMFGGGGGAGGAPGGFGGSFRVDDLGDLLGGLFGRRGGGRPGAGGVGPRRGPGPETAPHLSFSVSFAGATTAVK